MSKYVAVWIDHKEAHLFEIHPDKVDKEVVLAPHHVHKHPQPGGVKDHPEETKRFLHEVAHTLEGDEEILLVGPGAAKLELLRHLQTHHHALAGKVVGIETVDHPTDGQLVAYAKTYFIKVDRMR